ncbi:hypothetical protein EIN_403530 [Entamoeba invadens IP1]|uniref:Uncharacterized protein n=1 Tax=Entamoeba invadens IP1 TaxID=370355 RepID=A0A0A1UCK2_ENTIV|nr:hypothetical protein EIN_403530 [Entamoeba invadens IP1]ELP90019.1 hypothetical protein EIN_403530 [Entamoeba invadens IP1]|eukprot:XP_004256790.1 hypothetical protein EIN_403530 [Entamoeba invadens IP1]
MDVIDSDNVFKSVIYTDVVSNVRMLSRENFVYVGSYNGGPIACYPDPNKLTSGGRQKIGVTISDGKGAVLNEIELEQLDSGDNIYHVGWLDDYRLIIVTRKRYIYMYTTDGNLVDKDDSISASVFRQGNPRLTTVSVFGTGVLILFSVEVMDPNTQQKINRSFITLAVYNTKKGRFDIAKKMIPYQTGFCCHYDRFKNVLHTIFFDEVGKAVGVEDMFHFFQNQSAKLQPLGFTNDPNNHYKGLEVLNCCFSYDGSMLLTLQKDIKTQNFEINVFKFVVVQTTVEVEDPTNPKALINVNRTSFALEFQFVYNFDQTAHLGQNNKMFWLDNDLFGVELYTNVFQIHSVKLDTEELLIDTIEKVYCIVQESDGVRFHALEEVSGEMKYTNILYCSYDEDLKKLREESPAYFLWKSFVQPEDASFVNKFSENVYTAIETVCKAALFVPDSDERQIQLMRSASYGLMLASPEDAKKSSPFMQTTVKLLQMLHTMNSSGCMMTFKEFFNGAAIERGRLKDSLHNHTKNCADFYYHPIQTILVSLNLFSLCSVWTEERGMSIEALEEQWCYRKARKIMDGADSDILRFKRHMMKLSPQGILRVIDVCMKKPQLELICEIATVSNICREAIIKKLTDTLCGKQYDLFLTYLAKICMAYCDSQSFYLLLEKVCVKNGSVNPDDFVLIRKMLENPTSSIVQSVEGNIGVMKFCQQFDTIIQQSSFALFQRWNDQYALFQSLLARTRVPKEHLVAVSNTLLKFETPSRFLQRVFVDDTMWIWEIHGDKQYKDVVKSQMDSGKDVSGISSDSIYEQCCSIYRQFDLEQKEVERNAQNFKTKMNIDDRILLRAKIAVLNELNNGEEKKSRLEHFASIKKLDLFACETLAFIAHEAELPDLRNKFLSAFNQQKTKRLELLLRMNDEESALAYVKSEKDSVSQLQLCTAMLLHGVTSNDVKMSLENIRKGLSS